jgi:hypothetical protein
MLSSILRAGINLPAQSFLKKGENLMHKIPFDTGEEERLIGPLSMSSSLWLGLGLLGTFQTARALPPLPLPHLFAYVHYIIPLIFGAAMAFVKYKDMTLMQYAQAWLRYKFKNKSLVFGREIHPKDST